MASSTVVLFDFDKTIIDIDSDRWVIEQLGATEIFNRLFPTLPWNSLMDRVIMELHSQGRTIDEIVDCLKRVPLDPHIISAIKSAHSLGCDLRVVSDANLFYIETILKHHGILGCFTEINTNPTSVNEEGRLRIFPYHDSTILSHGCNLCHPTMCKGKIIERIRTSTLSQGKKRFVYLGDGKGDYCPALKLSEEDYVMPRKNHPLSNLIANRIDLVKAAINEWSNGEELKRILLQIIEPSSTANLVSVDHKFEMIQLALHGALPQ